MIKKKVEVLLHREVYDLYCDECKSKMKMNEFVLASNPPQYSYTCPNCGKTIHSFTVYPSIEEKWIDIEEYKKPVMD